MLYIACITGLWITGGLLLFLSYDEYEMKKDVPYSHLPAIVPLQTWRSIICSQCVVAGLPLAVFYGSRGAIHGVRDGLRRRGEVTRRFRRRFGK